MLLEMDKAAIRRHLGIAFAGIGGFQDTIGIRTVTRAGQLEWYMNALQPPEESILLGAPFGQALLFGPVVLNQVLGFTITTNLTAVSPYSPTVWPTIFYTVTQDDLNSQYPLAQVAANAALAINQAGTGVICATGKISTADANIGGYPGFAEMYFMAANRQTFQLVTTGPLQLGADGTVLPYPQLSVESETSATNTVYSGMLPLCNYLESSMYGVDARLAFWQAGASSTGQVNFNRMELRQRQALYRYTVRQMAVLLGFTLGEHQGVGPQAYGIPGT
jgi:hypothetical protein